MTSNAPLPTANPDWGFFGTIRRHADPSEAWAIAMPAIAVATGCPESAVREFLDSRHGRHFADDVANSLPRTSAGGLAAGRTLRVAVDAGVRRWMGWTIGRRTERETGIPRGLPYLTGFVIHCEIESLPRTRSGAEAGA